MNHSPLIDTTACSPEHFDPLPRIFSVLGFALFLGPLAACRAPSPTTKLAPSKHAPYFADERSVEQTLRKIFDRPSAPLTVKPVSIEGDFAVAGWLQNGTGGRTFLKRQQGQWKIALCGDAGLLDPTNLEKMGMAPSAAASLADKIKSAESGLTAQERTQISKFHGVVHIGAGLKHPVPQ